MDVGILRDSRDRESVTFRDPDFRLWSYHPRISSSFTNLLPSPHHILAAACTPLRRYPVVLGDTVTTSQPILLVLQVFFRVVLKNRSTVLLILTGHILFLSKFNEIGKKGEFCHGSSSFPGTNGLSRQAICRYYRSLPLI